MNKDKAAQVALINAAFDALPDMTRGLVEQKRKLYYLNRESECQHRKSAPVGHYAGGISKELAARLFTVKHLADALTTAYPLTVKDILSIRVECLVAQALAETYGLDILGAWVKAGLAVADIAALDYAALVRA